MAVKYLAGERLIGTAAERAALTTSVEGSPTADAWKEIKRFTATGSQNELDTGTFTAKDYLMFLIYIPIVSNNHDPKLTFNGDPDSADTYNFRKSVAGATSSDVNDTYYMDLYMHGGDAAQFVVGEIVNRSGVKKNFRYQGVTSGTAGNTAVQRREWFGVWNNTAQITSMKVHSGTGTNYNFPAGSEIIVLGMDIDETATTGANASPAHDQLGDGTDAPFWNQLSAIDPLTADGVMHTTFADKNYLYTELFLARTTNGNKGFFPNDDNSSTVTPCTFVYNANGGDSDGSVTSREAIQITSADNNDEFSFTRCWIANPDDKEKLFIIHTTEAGSASDTYNAQNAPQRNEGSGKWTKTDAGIIKLSVSDGDGVVINFKTGSFMRVWGND